MSTTNEFFQSAEIDQLAAALSQVQAELPEVPKDRHNPHLGSDYPSVESIIFTARELLAKHDLAVTHTADGEYLVTTLMHTSGQWLRGRLPVRSKPMQSISQRAVTIMQYAAKKNIPIELPDAIAMAEKEILTDQDPQSQGAGLTYARRHALLALLNMAVADSSPQRPEPDREGRDNGSQSGDAPTCECGAPMVERSSQRGKFYGCSKYPNCRNTKPIDDAPPADEGDGSDVVCPACGKGKMVKGAKGWVCEKCGVCVPACPKCGRSMCEQIDIPNDVSLWACTAPDCDGTRQREREADKPDDDIPF